MSYPPSEKQPLFSLYASNQKYIPPRNSPWILLREHIWHSWLQEDSPQAVLLAAGAGMGKTTLLASFAEHCPIPCAWYTVDEDDCSPDFLARGLLQSVRKVLPGSGHHLEALLAESALSEHSAKAVLQALHLDAVELGSPLVIILDDYQLLPEDADIHRWAGLFLQRLPAPLRVIIASRRVPPFPLARLQAMGDILVIKPGGLLLTADESAQVLCLERFGRNSRELQPFPRHTQGWPIAIHYLRESLTIVPDQAFPESLQAAVLQAKQNLRVYMNEEMYVPLPSEIRQRLLKYAVLGELDEEAPRLLFRDVNSASALSYLVQHNVGIMPVSGNRYYLLPLWREFLLRKLPQEEPKYLALHHLVCEYWEKKQRLDRAVDNLIALEEYSQAANYLDVLAKQAESLQQEHAILERREDLPKGNWQPGIWLTNLIFKQKFRDGFYHEAIQLGRSLIPLMRRHGAIPEMIRIHLTMAKAWDYLLQPDKSQYVLEEAMKFSDQVPYSLWAAVHYNLAVVHSMHRRVEKALDLYGKILSHPMDTSPQERDGLKYFHWALMNKADIHAWRGDLLLAEQDHQEALAFALQEKLATDRLVFTLSRLMEVECELGRMPEACAHFDMLQALNWRAACDKQNWAEILNRVALYWCYQGDLDQAEALLNEVVDLHERLEQLDIYYTQALTRLGTIARQRGQLIGALTFHQRAVHLAKSRGLRQVAPFLLELAHTHLVMNNNTMAEKVLIEAGQILQTSESLYLQAKLELFLACLENRQYRKYEALSHLRSAIDKIVNSRYYGYLVQIQPIMKELNNTLPDAKEILQFVKKPPLIPLKIQCFGDFVLWLGDQRVPNKLWRVRKARLIFLLLLFRREGYTKEELLHLLWPDLDTEAAQSNLYTTFYHIQQVLKKIPESRSIDGEPFILQEKGRYRINFAIPYELDIERFQEILTLAKKAEIKGERDQEIKLRHLAKEIYGDGLLTEKYFFSYFHEERKFYCQAFLRNWLRLADLLHQGDLMENISQLLDRCLVNEANCEDCKIRIGGLLALINQ